MIIYFNGCTLSHKGQSAWVGFWVLFAIPDSLFLERLWVLLV